MQKVEKILFDLNIDTVLIHSPNDANQDHVSAFQICSTAARHCDNILIFNINGYITRVGFAPNFFVDISGEPFFKKSKPLLITVKNTIDLDRYLILALIETRFGDTVFISNNQKLLKS